MFTDATMKKVLNKTSKDLLGSVFQEMTHYNHYHYCCRYCPHYNNQVNVTCSCKKIKSISSLHKCMCGCSTAYTIVNLFLPRYEKSFNHLLVISHQHMSKRFFPKSKQTCWRNRKLLHCLVGLPGNCILLHYYSFYTQECHNF